MSTRWATCPECSSTHEVVSAPDPERPLATRQVFRRHGTVDLDECLGSDRPPPVPARPQGGWRVQIQSRDDGVLQAPLRVGPYDESQADADEQWLRQGRYRDPHWPAIDASAERWIEYLSPDDVRYELELQAGQLRLAREMDDVHAELARGRLP